MSLSEVSMTENDNNEVFTYDNSQSLEERLSISFINLNNRLPGEYDLNPTPLSEEKYTKIRDWRKSIKKNRLYFPPVATTTNELNFNALLYYINGTVLNEKNSEIQTSEIGFTIDSVSPLIKYLFPALDEIQVKCEKSSHTSANETSLVKRVRTDLIIVSNGFELGCGEIKPPCVDDDLVDEDRGRIAEIMKRQLHVRIMHAKDIKEFVTFGLVFIGDEIELYVMSFNPENYEYDDYAIDTLKLPTSLETYTSLEETLEFLASYKNLIVSTLPSPEDLVKPLIYPNFTRHFKPTISFLTE